MRPATRKTGHGGAVVAVLLAPADLKIGPWVVATAALCHRLRQGAGMAPLLRR
jgi:hypothetical protein